jgi:carboxypeptidase family protein
VSLPLVLRPGRSASSPRRPGRPIAGLLCSALLAALPADARESTTFGTINGRVEAPDGAPIGGAVISFYGGGQGSFVTVSDREGRFSLDVPAGRYTLRTLAGGFLAPAARRVRVAAERELLLDISLATEAAAASLAAAQVDPAAVQELRWLIRHKRRSVLEDVENTAAFSTGAQPPALPRVQGACWILAAPPASASTEPIGEAKGASAVALGGALPGGRWSAGGVWPDGDTPAWRAAAELSMAPGPRLEWRAASAWAGREGIGTLLTEARWRVSRRVAATGAMRYTYGASEMSRSHLDPGLGLELSRLPLGTRLCLRSEGGSRLAGGDPLAAPDLPVATLAASGAGRSVRRQRRHELTFERPLRGASIGLHAFSETSDERPMSRASTVAPLGLSAHGAGVRLTAALGPALRGAAIYSAGRRRPVPGALEGAEPLFHELIAELEARFDRVGTRVKAHYRIHRAEPEDVLSRYDVQIHQGLPFLDGFTHSHFEILLAVRNLVYDATDPGSPDELVPSQAPTRVVGGISLKF